MRTLWGRMTSINVQKVAWVLAETGLPYEQVDVGGSFGGLDTDAYRDINPLGRIPTLQEDAVTLWESNAICRYLVDAYGGPLQRLEAAEKAKSDMWMEWFQNGPYAPFITMFYQTVRLAPRNRDPETLQSALSTLHEHFEVASDALERQPFLGGDAPSLADIPFGSCLFRYYTVDIERPEWSAIDAYYTRLKARPAYQEAVMVDYQSLAATS